ncbi:MAG: MBL fold metallo-hydrolase [Candidatus Berkelbacteria bacterium]
MIITWQGGKDFTLKTKGMNVVLADKCKLGDLEIDEPGEYEVGGVQLDWIDGVKQVYLETLNIGHIQKGKVFTDEELEKLNGIDILLIGVGGGDFTETKTALAVINQIDPSVIIPMYSGNIEEFIKEEGGSTEAEADLKITKADLPVDGRRIVTLNAEHK